jgi:hypothetical protein
LGWVTTVSPRLISNTGTSADGVHGPLGLPRLRANEEGIVEDTAEHVPADKGARAPGQGANLDVGATGQRLAEAGGQRRRWRRPASLGG